MQFLLRKAQVFLFVIISVLSFKAVGQKSLYNNEEAIRRTQYATDMIYGMHWDSVEYAIEQVRISLPNHPVVPLLEGIEVLWLHIPVLKDQVFDQFKDKMYESISRAKRMGDDHAEGIYFEMACRGLLAEYYADRGLYLKAVNEASKSYSLLLEGFELIDEVPDFLFATGIYNYFREVYPEKYPIYKSFLWLFKSGDRQLGIQQIKRATQEAVLVKVEAYIYLAYIYLRYEQTPLRAQKYLRILLEKYPGNLYAQAKYLESLNHPDYYDEIPRDILGVLTQSKKPYYELAGYTFGGIYVQNVQNKPDSALQLYEKAIDIAVDLKGHGEYYQSYSYYGAGQILRQKGDYQQAEEYFEKAYEKAQTKDLRELADDQF